MKRRNFFGMLVLVASMAFTACSENNSTIDDGDEPTEEELDLVIATYIDKAVLPTYADMEAKVATLKTAVEKFVNDGTQESLEAACLAWRAAREPWELSESFLFGPADFLGLDPMIDTWPLDKDAIDQILANKDFDKVGDDENIRGFHTLEYLLFEEGKRKDVAKVTANDKTYMSKVVTLLDEDTKALRGEWTQSYAAEFKKHTSSRIGSAQEAVSEIVDGCMTIADEVGSQKIGTPVSFWKAGNKERAVLEVESWYSWNSLDDYRNNIISIENSYMGGRRGERNAAGSLSTLVKKYNPDLDAEVQAAIKKAIDAIDGIPAPFRNNLDKKTEIENAQDVLDALESTLLKIKRTLVL